MAKRKKYPHLHSGKIKKDYNLRQRYKDFNLEKYNELYVTQDARCAICQCSFIRPEELEVDHCHETDNVRGLLCGKCNRALGLFNDDISSLERAIKYLNDARKLTQDNSQKA